jgi:hypothetical protein
MFFFLQLSHLQRTSSYPPTLQSSNHSVYTIAVVITLDIDERFGLVYISIWSGDICRRRVGSLNQRHPPSSMERLSVVPQTLLSVVENNIDSCLSVRPSTVTFRLVSTAANFNSTIDCQPKYVWNANCLSVCCHSGAVMIIYTRYANTPGSRAAPVPLQFSHNHGQRR